MKRKTLFVVTSFLAILGLLMASCAPSGGPAPQTDSRGAQPTPKGAASPQAKPPAETARYGGVLTSYTTGNPPSLDAQQESTINTSLLVSPIYTTLVQGDPLTVDKWVPALAEKWEMSRDGLSWTFDMRQGVKFHDGTPFTVDDAIYNLQRITDPPKGIVSNLSFLLKPVVNSIEKDAGKLKIALKYPYAIMLDTLGMNYAPIYSQKYVEKAGDMKTTAMGTGPFKLKSYTPGVGLEAVKNPDFWVRGRPYLDGYRYLFLKDDATRLSAFRTGKVNMTGKVFATFTPDQMETAKKENAEAKFYTSPTFLSPWFFMNVRNAPFHDQKVRKAISLALDRQAALKVLAQGNGVIGKVFPVEPWGIPMEELNKMPGYRQPKDADIAEAKKLMQAAGYPNGFELTVLARQMSQSKDAAVFMTNQLAQLNIRAKVQTLEDVIFFDTGRKAGHEAMVYTPTTNIADPHWLGRYFVPGGALNFAGNENDKELIAMWDEQIRAVDPEKRKAILRKVEEHVLEALPAMSVAWPYSYIGVRPEVRNFTAGMSDFAGNTLEEIWLAK